MSTVLITGCSSGFGLETAVLLAKNGFRVFATMRDLGKRARLDAALAAAGVKAELLALDVTSEASIAAAVDAVIAAAGRIDALVNNAGFGIGGFIEDMTLDEYRRQFDTNFFGLVAVTKAVLPHMRKARAGRILNVSSVGGRAANPAISAYAATKFAVEGFSEALSFEAGLFGVKVILIEPGAFKTEIFESNMQTAAGLNNAASPYFEASRTLLATVDKMVAKLGGDPKLVAKAILHALTTPKPRLRYLVGTDAKIMAFLHGLSFRAYAGLIRRQLGLSSLAAKIK
jgi:NAD(P)-dependent dehydrogenase (short-subunit alcohol dehydrogenase family)